jgi:hypothetical protein
MSTMRRVILRFDGPLEEALTGDELRSCLVALRMFPHKFARDREVSRSTVFRWMDAERVPIHVEERIRVLLAERVARHKLAP